MSARTWRADWDALMRGDGCPMCASRGAAETEHGIRVLEGSFADVYLQKRAPQRGYAIGIWKRSHVAEPTDLSREDRDGYFTEVFAVGAALRRLPAPGRPLPIELT